MIPKKIIIFTRNPQVHLHLEIAKQMREKWPEVPILFATFFEWAAKRVRKSEFSPIYLPTALREANLDSAEKKIQEIDRQLFDGFGIGINLMLNSERFLPKTQEAILQFLKSHVVVLDQIIEEGTLSISSMYDHFIYWLAGSLSNIRNGAHFSFVACGFPSHSVLALKTPWEPWQGPMRTEENVNLQQMRDQLRLPPTQRMEYMAFNPTPPFYRRLTERHELLQADKVDRVNGSYFAGKSFLSRTKIAIEKRIFSPSRHDYFFDIRTNEELETWAIPFFYIPLHMEPEATILMYCPWFRDQIEMSRLCSQAMPAGMSLLVKENPKMNGLRTADFYRALRSLPGISLVHPSVSTYELTRRSEGVVSLAGSACLEATLLGKPSLVFGRPPFRHMVGNFDSAEKSNVRFKGLSRWMRNPKPTDPEMVEQGWQKWIRGTFKGSAVQRYSNGQKVIDGSPENAAAFVQYILATINQKTPSSEPTTTVCNTKREKLNE